MAYTQPDFDAALATWGGASVYTRPDFDAADASFYTAPTSTIEGYLSHDPGLPSPPQVLGVVWRQGEILDGGLPLAPRITGYSGSAGYLTAASMLGAAAILGRGATAWLYDGGLPVPPLMTGYFDLRPYIDETAPVRFVMDLVVGSELVRVPISSWQGTLQVDQQCYLACVVPACADWLESIYAATEFIVSRVARLNDGSPAEVFVARAPLDNVTVNRGSVNYTASLSGYFDAFEVVEDPDALYDVELTGVRSVASYATGTLVRCSIDWLLRPSQRANWTEGGLSFVVSYINFYAIANRASIDAYMDVGERVAS